MQVIMYGNVMYWHRYYANQEEFRHSSALGLSSAFSESKLKSNVFASSSKSI